MNKIEYVVEVTMTAHHWDNELSPYFWSIKYFDEGIDEWVSKICGWEKTPEDAWKAANIEYKELIS